MGDNKAANRAGMHFAYAERMKKIIAFLVLCSCSAVAQVEAPSEVHFSDMSVDIANQAISPQLLDRHQVQAEAAYMVNQFDDGARALIFQGVARYGLSRRVELGLSMEEGYNRDRYIEETSQGVYPLALTNKLALVKSSEKLPDISLITYLKLPFTSRTQEQQPYWSPMFILSLREELIRDLGLIVNFGTRQGAYDSEWAYPVNASLECSLTGNVGVFANYYAQYQPEKHPQHNAGGGVTLQIRKVCQFFLTGGSTINPEHPNFYFSAGVAFRKL
jgi:hypothetical protein